MRSEDEFEEEEAFESETSFYREPTTGNKRIIRRYVHRLATLLNELIIEDENLESMFGKSTERYFRHYPKFGERAWLRPGGDFDVVLWDEGNGWYTVLAIIFKSGSLYEWVKDV
jgi:hypothetical protein